MLFFKIWGFLFFDFLLFEVFGQNDTIFIGIRPFPPLTNCALNDTIPLSELDLNTNPLINLFFSGYELEIILFIF